MILRKPYAFIIKRFRLIHLLMFICTAFLVYKVNNIYSFLTAYIKDGYFVYENNLAGNYVNLYMYISIGVIITLALIVIALFVWKKVDFKYYAAEIAYYVIVFISLLIMFGFLNKILTTNIDTRTLKLYRDMSLIINLPGFYFVITSLINAIGFNIKKFDFSKDLKTLNADVADNEEFEFMVGKDTYKYKRRVRRAIREAKYYIKENTFFFSILCGVLVVVTGVSLYLSLYVFKQNYDENETFLAGGLSYTVKESYLTNIDYAGNVISDSNLYLIVRVNVSNVNFSSVDLDIKNYRIMIDNQPFYPVTNKGNYFIDFGDTTIPEEMPSKTQYDVLFIYELDDDYFNGSYTFRIVNNVSALKGEIAASYSDTIIKPKHIEQIETVGVYSVNKEATFEDSALGKSNLTIKRAIIRDSFKESYKYCISNNCYTATETIAADNIGRAEKTLIRLTLDYYISEESNLYSSVLNAKNLFNNFGSITYISDGKSKTRYLKNVTPNYVTDDTVYLEVPKEVETSVEATINLTIRDKKYVFVLKN